jgi:tripartite-type tricarboxylate transporter receptor subunit TctC
VSKALAAAFVALAFICTAHAQQYPTKPIRFIVGPGPDALARVIGEKLTMAWGQQILVDQRGGGGGSISAEIVAKAQPDGYTVLLATGTHLIMPSLYRVPFDMQKDFAPVTLVAATPFILAVHPKVEAMSVASSTV